MGWNTLSAIRLVSPLLAPLLASIAIVAGDPAQSPGQQFGNSFGSNSSRQLSHPTTSPYLNLAQPGLDPAITYEQMVRPQRLFRRTLTAQSQSLTNLERTTGVQSSTTSESQPVRIKQTGHSATFMSTGSYFPTLNSSSRNQQQAPAKRRR
jgi:hypothetical protein